MVLRLPEFLLIHKHFFTWATNFHTKVLPLHISKFNPLFYGNYIVMESKKIQSALISVFHKEGLAPIVAELEKQGIKIYSTGGTKSYIEQMGVGVEAIENLTSYPSILDGRVKTLHPKVFGGLLARREESHLAELAERPSDQRDQRSSTLAHRLVRIVAVLKSCHSLQ